ncbi:MAG TPA: sensor histidine kinase [Pyrinomonadaceae bacterium]
MSSPAKKEKTPETVLDEGTISFQAEGRLLQELGERLVARPEVALVELIKNAYDADSPSCEVRLEEAGKVLTIADQGHGMTFDDFANKWMRIATSTKVGERVSRVYRRRLTGAKGIGRFAVRYLGSHLTLITIAEDKKRRSKTRLTARFDWLRIDQVSDINKAKVDYTLEQVAPGTPTGTSLQIRKLKTPIDFIRGPSFRADVLRIVTPVQGLEAGRFKPAHQDSKTDPGFRVTLPGDPKEGTANVDLAEFVLSNYWARLKIELKGKLLTFKVSFPSSRVPKILKVRVSTAIAAGFVADIRFFPRRKGVFQQKGVNGKAAWQWVLDNHGVAVVDHGFRVVPYGYESDDWLHLDLDHAHNERDWRSEIAKKYFPIPDAVRNRPKEDPALNIPYNRQLIGAVFVESKPSSRAKHQDLTPAMDREGFLENKAFTELTEFVRAGIEFLALQDKRELERKAAAQAREATKNARAEVRDAIAYIRQSRTLSATDRANITKAYMRLADRIEEVEEYNAQSRQNLITMSLLGVVAGFMTHETNSVMFEMQKAAEEVLSLSKKHPTLKGIATELNKRLLAFKGQLEYAQMFLRGVRNNKPMPMSAAGQIRYVLKRFESFATDHGIEISWEASSDTKTPSLAPAVYSGVILNLYTNALKAVLSAASSIRHPKVSVRAWNENRKHILEVSDNGVGVPPQLRKRIWDPLYTTTSDTGNPLGSGMGLGLSLVKHVVEDSSGRIELVDEPPPGFNTCFRVVFPLE